MNHEKQRVAVRKPQWIYLGPIAAAPIAHICVTLYRDAKTPQQKRLLLGVGVIGSTLAMVGMRVGLMFHAGYPGQESQTMASERTLWVTPEEKAAIENPTVQTIAREAFRGFA